MPRERRTVTKAVRLTPSANQSIESILERKNQYFSEWISDIIDLEIERDKINEGKV